MLLTELYLKKGVNYKLIKNIDNYKKGSIFKFVKETPKSLIFIDNKSKSVEFKLSDYYSFENTHMNEEMTPDDIQRIRDIIRDEIAEIYFELYRKRSVWS